MSKALLFDADKRTYEHHTSYSLTAENVSKLTGLGIIDFNTEFR